MTRDIVERLRERAASYRMSGPSAEHTAALLDEAADKLSAISSSPLPPAGRDYTDFGVDANDPESAIAAELDNGPDAARIMRVLNDLGFVIVRQPLASPPVPEAPGHTDLMVTPESLDAWLDANPPPPVPVGEPKPFAWHCIGKGEGWVESKFVRSQEDADYYTRPGWTVTPLYASPPVPVGEPIWQHRERVYTGDGCSWSRWQDGRLRSGVDGEERPLYAAPSVGDELVKALTAILREPYGCVFCDSGVLRDPKKSHRDDCGYTLARKALGLREGEAP